MSVFAIRGAITCQNNEQSIKQSARELIAALVQKNALCEQDVVSIVVSSTMDITACYPVQAVREFCFANTALFSCLEPPIEGSLPLCIRMLITVNKPHGFAPQHVYLKGAIVLRKDWNKLTIAIDGPSGTGKSTVAHALAQHLGLTFLDTGALYRAVAVYCNRHNCKSEQQVTCVLDKIKVSVALQNGQQSTFLNGEDVSQEIRKNEISVLVSQIAGFGLVRQKMLLVQREIAQHNGVVLEGRDIGTVVLPDADFKFFLHAQPLERAKRRQKQLEAQGTFMELNTLLKEIEERDYNDTYRAIAPLKKAEDAYEIDTTMLSIEGVVQRIMEIIRS